MYSSVVLYQAVRQHSRSKIRYRSEYNARGICQLPKIMVTALFLHKLAGLTCYVELKTNYSWIKDKKYLSELVGTEYESDLPPNLAESIKSQPQVKQWASKIELESISSSPISAVIFNAGRGGNLIEVESEEVYPSPAGLARERGFQRQLAVKIRKKIDSSSMMRVRLL